MLFTNSLSFIDILGEEMNLTLNNNTRIKTILGGIFSLIILIFISIWFLYECLDIINKTNPISITEQQLQINETVINLNQIFIDNNITCESYVNTINKISLINSIENITLNLNISPEENQIDKDYQLIQLIDNEEELKFISLKISNCTNCNNLTFKILLTNYFIDIIQYNNNIISYIENINIEISDNYEYNLYFQKQNIITDYGLIFKKEEITEITSYIGYDKYKNLSPYTIINMKPSIFKLNYFRSYKKIQTILAEIGAFSKLVLILVKILISYFISIEKNTTILNKLFHFDFTNDYILKVHPNINPNFIINEQSKDQSSNNLNQKFAQSNNTSNIYLGKNAKKNNINNSYQLNESIRPSQNQLILFDAQSNKVNSSKSTIHKHKLDNNLKKNVIDALSNFKEKKNKIYFSIFEVISLCFNKCQVKSKNTKKEITYFKSVDLILNNFFEICNQIKKWNEIDILKDILLNEEQKIIYNYLSKEKCLINSNTLNKLKDKGFQISKEDLINLINDYHTQLDSSNVNKGFVDYKLYKLIWENI